MFAPVETIASIMLFSTSVIRAFLRPAEISEPASVTMTAHSLSLSIIE